MNIKQITVTDSGTVYGLIDTNTVVKWHFAQQKWFANF